MLIVGMAATLSPCITEILHRGRRGPCDRQAASAERVPELREAVIGMHAQGTADPDQAVCGPGGPPSRRDGQCVCGHPVRFRTSTHAIVDEAALQNSRMAIDAYTWIAN